MAFQRASLDIGCIGLTLASSIFDISSLIPVGDCDCRDHRNAQFFFQLLHIYNDPPVSRLIHHVEGDDNGDVVLRTCIAMTRFLSSAVASMTRMTISAPSFRIRRAMTSTVCGIKRVGSRDVRKSCNFASVFHGPLGETNGSARII